MVIRGQPDLARVEAALRAYDADPSPANQQKVVALKLACEAADRAAAQSRRAAAGRLDKLSFWADMMVPEQIARMTPRARLLPHQHHVKIALSPESEWRSMLMVHDVGTGKSRTAMAVAENLLRARAATHVYVVGPSALRGNYVREVAPYHQATYARGLWDLPDSVGRPVYANRALTVTDPDPAALRRALWGLVRASYTFIGYREFHNRFAEVPPDQLAVVFADTLVVVDEAHNLRVQAADQDSKKVTPLLRRILAGAPNTRLLLMTATPMFDMDSEVITLLNLMNVNDGRPEVRTMDDVRAAVRERVSVSRPRRYDPRFPLSLAAPFVKGPAGSARDAWPARDAGGARTTPPPTAPPYVHHAAGKYQSDLVEVGEVGKVDKVENEAASLVRQTVCNVVFPPSMQATEKAFADVFDMKRGAYAPGREGFFRDALRDHGAKLAGIVDCVEATVHGPTVIFSNFLWAGVYPLALAFEERGFRPHSGPPLLRASSSASTNSKKYAVIAQGSDKDRVISAFNRPSNAGGGDIAVLLCTRAVAEGVDLKNVRVLHIVEPWWNRGLTKQIIGRATRIYSHAAQLAEHRNVVVYEHLLAARGDRESYDHYIARTAAAKVARVARVERVLEAESFDCSLARADGFSPAARALDMVDAFGRGHRVDVADYEARRFGRPARCNASNKAAAALLAGYDAAAVSRATMEDLVAELVAALERLFAKARWYTLDQIRAAAPIDEALLYRAMAHILFHKHPIRVGEAAHMLRKKDDVYVLEGLATEQTVAMASSPLALGDEAGRSADRRIGERDDLKAHVTRLVETHGAPKRGVDAAAVARLAADPDFVFSLKKGRLCRNMPKEDIVRLGRQVFGDAVDPAWTALSKRDLCLLVRYAAET